MRKIQPPFLYLLLGIIQAAHSTEEYLTHFYEWFSVGTGYIHNLIGFFPVIRMSAQPFVVLNIALITFLLSISPFVFQNKSWASNVAKITAVGETLNGFGHISAAIYVGGYHPGCISAIGLLIVGTLLARALFKE